MLDIGSLSLLSQGGNGLVNVANQAFGSGLQNSANLKLAKYQYSKELDMWNQANAYNSPAAQMQRFKDAGLNPNLIYGQGNNGNTANQLPRYQAPTVRADINPGGDNMANINTYQDFVVKSAQADNLKANAELTKTKEQIALLDAFDRKQRNTYSGIFYGGRANLVSNKSKLEGYQSVITLNSLDDLVKTNIARRMQAEAMIPQIGARTQNISLMNEYQKGMNKYYGVNTGANITNKILPSIIQGIKMMLLKK